MKSLGVNLLKIGFRLGIALIYFISLFTSTTVRSLYLGLASIAHEELSAAREIAMLYQMIFLSALRRC